MARIAAEAEDSIRNLPQPSSAEILADAACHSAKESGAAAIMVFRSTGSSAKLVSRRRSRVSIFAVTPHDTAARQISVSYGTPATCPAVSMTDEMLWQMERVLVEGGHVQKGALVVFVAG